MDHDELIWMPATDQAEAIRRGDVSSAELVRAVFERIDAHDERVGAYVTLDRERALADADAADRAPGDGRGPLHGVPISVKDLIQTAGLRTTYGSALFKDFVPTEDACVVTRLRAAGAVIVGKTATSEFGTGAETWTTFGPRCNNPWDLERTAGGSSGGAGAALAAGMGSIALGSDSGGSIRLPAAWCGVTGLKPTFGRVPSPPGQRPIDHPVETTGPLARTVEDLALVMDVIAGYDPSDLSSSKLPVPSYREELRADRPLRIDWTPDAGLGTSDADVLAALGAAASGLGSAGVDVRSSTLHIGEPHPFMAMYVLVSSAGAGRLDEVLEGRLDELTPYAREFLTIGLSRLGSEYVRALHEAKRLRALVDDALGDADAIMLPSTAVTAWRHGQPPSIVGGEPVAEFGGIAYGGLPFLALANLTGHPAVNVPIGLDANGLPIGAQLIGRHFGEPALLRAAAAVEAVASPVGHPTL
jgi:aspartyl-tRNA(Asn)/glutamyl-tRNA(Gln) amidotransferase subunit A